MEQKFDIKAFPRGATQVMFQPSAIGGVLMLIGIFWGSIAGGHAEVAIGAVVGLVVSTLTGLLLALPTEDGEIGLWGFNGILVGCAFMTFLGSTPLAWVALVLCAAMTTWVREGLNKVGAVHKVSSFTFPFVLCTWLFFGGSKGPHRARRGKPFAPFAPLRSPLRHRRSPTPLPWGGFGVVAKGRGADYAHRLVGDGVVLPCRIAR